MIVWWELDEAMLIFFGVVFWFMISSWITLAAGILIPYGYINLKRHSANGYFKHLLYRAGFVHLDGYPSSFHTKFIE
jgi:hypothetical protein